MAQTTISCDVKESIDAISAWVGELIRETDPEQMEIIHNHIDNVLQRLMILDEVIRDVANNAKTH